MVIPFSIDQRRLSGYYLIMKRQIKLYIRNNRRNYLKYKNNALIFANQRIHHFNKIYNLRFKKINIKNQKTRWGSCSRKGNLNFNYKIILLPQNMADYIIVHELCHLKELNHSQNFWNLVKHTIPDYLETRGELRRIVLS